MNLPSALFAFTALVVLAGCGRKESNSKHDNSAGEPVPAVASESSQRQSAPEISPVTQDFYHSNSVTLLLGQETGEEGIKHHYREADGRTTIETLDGVPCRHLLRAPDKRNGFVYFSIHQDFKARELKTAQIEIEYLFPTVTNLKLQYDGTAEDKPKRYMTALPNRGTIISYVGGPSFSRITDTGTWQTATFQITNAVFLNSQNGGADFRLEVSPPDIYLRRVTVTRGNAESANLETKAN
jgi:hypothetical protein